MKFFAVGLCLMSAIDAQSSRVKRQLDGTYPSVVVSDRERGMIVEAIVADIEADTHKGITGQWMAAMLASDKNTTLLTNEIPGWVYNWYESTLDGFRTMCEPHCGSFIDLSPIWGYGCWCFFGDHAGKGFGTPVNKIDSICKEVAHCYRCAVWDGDNENEACDPWNTVYDANFNHLVSDESGVESECKIAANPENCQWRTCSCEMKMIASFFRLVFDPTHRFDESYKHDNGFDWRNTCQADTQEDGEKACCGYYPNRKSYNIGPSRECCRERTLFNPRVNDCCDDGNVMGFGSGGC